MKILVTGATGFIGNYVIKELLKKNLEIVATSSNIAKAKKNEWFENVKYKELNFQNIDNKINYFEFFEKPDLLIHLAWEGLPNYKNDFHITENLPKHKFLLTNLINNGLLDITAIGTCFEYGMKEGALNETMHCEPTNAYAIAKNELRIYLEQLSEKNSFNYKWVRLFYMYGKGQTPKSLFSQLEKALQKNEQYFNMSGGEQKRDFLPIIKVAENIVNIALQTKINGIINCCSGIPITLNQFVENYLKEKNKYIKLNLGYYPYLDYEPMCFWGDNHKLKSVLEN